MRNILITFSIIAAVLGAALYVAAPQPQKPAVTTTSAPAIGGAFTLTDDDGKPFTEQNMLGKHHLVFFGFTNCPDVCPTTLYSITELMGQVDDAGERLVPLFVSVDVQDTPETMHSYLSNFHPAIVGLSGDEAQIKQVTSAYKVYYARVEQPESSAGYTMDHSSYVFLMGPDGKYITHFRYQQPLEEMAERINYALEKP